jgi:hypothetical protein
MSEKINAWLKRQKQREAREAEALQRSLWNLRDQKTLIAIELDQFLREEMPNLEPMQRLHMYQLSEDLRKKFVTRCIQKGLIKV